MCVQHEETKHLQVILLADLTHSTEVSKGLGHFTVINIQERIVHPVSCKRLVIGCLGLCDLILVMREDQIFATGMNIYIKNAGSDIYPLRANTMLPALKYKPDQRVQCEKPHAQTIRSAFR